jgi:hypothetical protein
MEDLAGGAITCRILAHPWFLTSKTNGICIIQEQYFQVARMYQLHYHACILLIRRGGKSIRILPIFITFLLLTALLMQAGTVRAASSPGTLEQAMSDTLDQWREGRYEQLYDHLAHRGKTSREQFVKKMQDTSIRPACCFQKLENFRVLNEKRTEATVYARVGLEGSANAA